MARFVTFELPVEDVKKLIEVLQEEYNATYVAKTEELLNFFKEKLNG